MARVRPSRSRRASSSSRPTSTSSSGCTPSATGLSSARGSPGMDSSSAPSSARSSPTSHSRARRVTTSTCSGSIVSNPPEFRPYGRFPADDAGGRTRTSKDLAAQRDLNPPRLPIPQRPRAAKDRALVPVDEARDGLSHALRDEAHERDHGEDRGSVQHLARRRQHEQRGEASEHEERGGERPSRVRAEPEAGEERGTEHHDPERHGARVGPVSDGADAVQAYEEVCPMLSERAAWRDTGILNARGPVAQSIERQTSNLRAEVRLLPGPCPSEMHDTFWQIERAAVRVDTI